MTTTTQHSITTTMTTTSTITFINIIAIIAIIFTTTSTPPQPSLLFLPPFHNFHPHYNLYYHFSHYYHHSNHHHHHDSHQHHHPHQERERSRLLKWRCQDVESPRVTKDCCRNRPQFGSPSSLNSSIPTGEKSFSSGYSRLVA